MVQATKQVLANRHAGAMKLATFEAAPDYSALRYDYEQIDAEHRERVQAAAVEILAAGKRAKESIITMGQKLIDIKAILPEWTFTAWLTTEFELSERMAQNMMNVARQYGERPEIISVLNDTVLYLLAAPSTPDSARDEVEALALAEGRSPKVEAVKGVIADHRGIAPLPAPEPEYTPVAELQRLVGEWVAQRSKDPLTQIYYLKGIADSSDTDTLDKLVGFLKRVHPIDHYRDEDLAAAIQAEHEKRKQVQAEKAAKRGPEPPSEWKLREAIEAWLATRSLRPKEQHALLLALKEKEEDPKSPFRDVEHQRFIAALPQHWRKRELKQALSNLADHVSWKVGGDEWETHQLPSGRWYAQNKARNPAATGVFDTAEQALLASDDANQGNRQLYDQLNTVIHDEREHWRENEFFNEAAPELIAEAKLALDKKAEQPDAPAYVALRLKRIEARVHAAQRLLEITASVPSAPHPHAADLTPPDLFDAGYMIVASPEGETFRWLNDDGEVGDWWQLDDAIADARKRFEILAPTPHQKQWQQEAEEAAAIAETLAFADFEAWLFAAPRQPDLRQILSILEYAKKMAQRARELDSDMINVVTDALIPWSRVVNKLERKVKYGVKS